MPFPKQWAMTQGLLVSALLERFQLTGEAENLDEGIASLQEAQTVAVPGTDSYVWINYTLGLALDYRYSLHSDPKDLEQAIAAYRLAANTTPWADRKLKYLKKPPTASTTWGLPWCSRASGTTGLPS
jgi:hypothetical protein